jgi:hypothetical protein
MLGAGQDQIDRTPMEVRQLASHDGGADCSSEGERHWGLEISGDQKI